MTLSREDVEHISRLALLALTPEEIERYQEQISAVLTYVQKLQDIDTVDVPSTFSVIESQTALRTDTWKPYENVKAILLNVPDLMGNQVRITDRSVDE
ncbi:MAG: Asp-tRNA(Asn)/Glu-tRNA(Gln) amidotransferase subunit GatC [Deltaproteobacteria bacterium]|nr:Asp-tRNA(Asn)/Glu-tRNA(Gln) amidotransferase subunit GatC [Deltaproteobacteria bacterium]